MLKFSASLFMFFNELPVLERFKAIADCGFTGVEYPFPYDFDKEILAEQLDKNHLSQVLINTKQGDWQAGDRGLAVLPDRINEFQDSIELAIDYAIALKCKQISVPAGIPPSNIDKEQIREIYLKNIQFAADKMAAQGIMLLVEAINTYDMPGFYISSSAHALDIINHCDRENVGMLYDIYHMQRMEGEISLGLTRCLPNVSHIQIADNPYRHEPGTGELNYDYLFQFIEELGYQGWIGCEYWPQNGTKEGLAWFEHYRNR